MMRASAGSPTASNEWASDSCSSALQIAWSHRYCTGQLTDLEQEPGAEVPSNHQPLCFAPLDFFLPFDDSRVESQHYALFNFVDNLGPCGGIVSPFWG